VPASDLASAGMRRHLRPSAACGARVGAAESFVSFIPLFGGPVQMDGNSQPGPNPYDPAAGIYLYDSVTTRSLRQTPQEHLARVSNNVHLRCGLAIVVWTGCAPCGLKDSTLRLAWTMWPRRCTNSLYGATRGLDVVSRRSLLDADREDPKWNRDQGE
jgi:hypothetical protein